MGFLKGKDGKKRVRAGALLLAVPMALAVLAGCAPKGVSTKAPAATPTPSAETKGSPTEEGIEQEPATPEPSSKEEENNVPVKIGCGESQRLALGYAGLTADQVEDLWSTLQKYEGMIIHEVTFVYDGTFYTYRINASTGEDMGFTTHLAE